MTYPEANTAGQAARGELRAGQPKALWITFGVITVVIGLAVMLWPGLTVLAAAVLFGVQLLVTGVFWLVGSFSADSMGHRRWLSAVAGLLALVAGILCLREPFQTVAVLALLLGATWVVGGVAEVFHGFGNSGWAVFSGVVTTIGGIVVLVWPVASVIALAWLLAVVLVVFGALAIAGAIGAGHSPKAGTRTAPTTGTSGPTGTTGTTATA
ncbi:HdeD family acid-resistance protein [Saccharothrix sp. HUAS TT1]|uniref:HdeD family acid-resistance protein n=1 Tax=unclassified Saccharothrix TaxID=2593673 RepID=UPI00345B686A